MTKNPFTNRKFENKWTIPFCRFTWVSLETYSSKSGHGNISQILNRQDLLQWDLNIIRVVLTPAFTTNAVTSVFFLNFPSQFSGDVPGLPSYGFYISQFDLLDVVLAFLISFQTIFKSFLNCWHRVTEITSYEKCLTRSLGHTLSFYSNFDTISFRLAYKACRT